MGSIDAPEARNRLLSWEGCHNVRDLGGLETAAGGRTRHGTVVRADNVRRLSSVGWRSMLDHGIRRVVDLRFEGEEADEPGVPDDIEVIGVSLFGRHDPKKEREFDERIRYADDVAAVFASGYIRTLERSPARVTSAVAAVVDGNEADGVLIHCFAGKDRTGIVTALLLGAVDVPDEVIAADYAESEQNMDSLFRTWVSEAADPAELELRRRIIRAPYATMLAVLQWLHIEAGGPERYLSDAGLAADQHARLRRRLLADPR